MALRTNTQLNADFPVDTLAHLKASATKFSYLVRDGQLKTDEIRQVLAQFGSFLDPLVNATDIVACAAVYTGAAGAVGRTYLAIPNYSLVDPSGFVATVKNLPGPPPYGRPDAIGGLQNMTDTRRRRYIGGPAAATALLAVETAVAATAATLDATHYVTITAPNPGTQHIAGLQYDIVAVNAGPVWNLIAANVAPGAAVVDNGKGSGPFADKDNGAGLGLYGAVYHLFAHTEVAWDNADTSVVYSPNTVYGGN